MLVFLFQALNSEPTSDQPRGVVISGGIGAGKTAVMEQLIDCSCFGDGKSGLIEGKYICYNFIQMRGLQVKVFKATFNYIVAVSFIGGGSQSTRKKPLTCRKSLTNFIT